MEPQGVPWSVWKPQSRPLVCVETSVTSYGLCGNLSHVLWSMWKPQSRPMVYVETSVTSPGLCGNLSHVPWSVWKPQSRPLVCMETSVTSLGLYGNLSHVPWSMWKPQSRPLVCTETSVTSVPWSVCRKPQSRSLALRRPSLMQMDAVFWESNQPFVTVSCIHTTTHLSVCRQARYRNMSPVSTTPETVVCNTVSSQ